MSDTPMTDRWLKNINGWHYVQIERCRELEQKLNVANERIKRLEEVGDAMLNAWLMPEDSMEYCDWIALSADAKAKWFKAKEDKP